MYHNTVSNIKVATRITINDMRAEFFIKDVFKMKKNVASWQGD